MSSEQDWRAKYLDALDEQERLLAESAQQQELLRRALVRASLAAEGQDEQLDRRLESLRDALREGGRPLVRALEGLESALLAFERERAAQLQRGVSSFKALIEALEAQTTDRQQRSRLKDLQRSLAERPADLSGPLAELAELQARAAEAASLAGPAQGEADSGGDGRSWLGRLLGRAPEIDKPAAGQSQVPDETEQAPDESPSLTPAPPETEAPVAEEPSEPEEPAVPREYGPLEGQVQTRAEARAADEQEAELQRPVHEPAFSRVSDKVYRVLTELLDKVEPAECTEQKAIAARLRLARGLNWFELVPTLEDIRDLVLQAYLMADEDYRAYLEQIHGVLADVLESLQISVDAQQQWQQSEAHFSHTLSRQLGSLSQSVTMATEITGLKQDIDQHLRALQSTLEERQSTAAGSDLNAQLQELTRQMRQAEQEAADTKAALQEERQKALTDALTGLPNREAYNERGHLEWHRWQRYSEPLTLAVCDIDRFKPINDNYGHQTGDRVLQVLARALSQRLREVDFIARYGGEEFVILLPNTALQEGFVLLDKIRMAVAGTPFRFKQEPVQVTLSAGVVALREGDTLETAFARADELLYRAKAEGRNRCLVEAEPPLS